MSASYLFVTFVGFQVPDEWLFETETIEVTTADCGHLFAEGAAFCGTCGARRSRKVPSTTRKLKRKLSDGDALYEDNLAPAGAGFEVRYYEAFISGENITLAGWQLSNMGRFDNFHALDSVPEMKNLAESLSLHGIPFIQGTWGVHKLRLTL